MSPTEVALVRESYGWVVPISEQAAAMFYDRLFSTVPDVKPLFKSDMKEQGRKLMAAIGLVVNALDRLETVLPAVKELAVRHVSYGVRDEHYDEVGHALLWTLEAGLGERFTAPHKAAWGGAYGALSGVMRAAAADEPRTTSG